MKLLLELPQDRLSAEFNEDSVLELTPELVGPSRNVQAGIIGEAVELKPDLDQVPALAAERDQQWARVATADFLTEDEKRTLLGLPRLTGHEVRE